MLYVMYCIGTMCSVCIDISPPPRGKLISRDGGAHACIQAETHTLAYLHLHKSTFTPIYSSIDLHTTKNIDFCCIYKIILLQIVFRIKYLT